MANKCAATSDDSIQTVYLYSLWCIWRTAAATTTKKNIELITCLQISKFINVHTCVLYIQQSAVKSMARARIYPKRIHFKPFNDSALLRNFQFVGITRKHFDTFDVQIVIIERIFHFPLFVKQTFFPHSKYKLSNLLLIH